MLGLCIMSCLQMLSMLHVFAKEFIHVVILGILQFALPVSITGAVYINGEKVQKFYFSILTRLSLIAQRKFATKLMELIFALNN